MIEVKIKHEKPENPIVGSNTEVPNHITINGESFSYNEVYEVEQAFYDKHSNIFKPINNN